MSEGEKQGSWGGGEGGKVIYPLLRIIAGSLLVTPNSKTKAAMSQCKGAVEACLRWASPPRSPLALDIFPSLLPPSAVQQARSLTTCHHRGLGFKPRRAQSTPFNLTNSTPLASESIAWWLVEFEM